MRNDDFWDKCTHGSIREAVAEFIDTTPQLASLKGDKYYAVEDAIVNFIERNKEKIYREVDREYLRSDVCTEIFQQYGENAGILAEHLPLPLVNRFVDAWQDDLENNDGFWEENWRYFRDNGDEAFERLFVGYRKLGAEDAKLYVAYLKDWFAHHPYPQECPVCVDEFFNCEMRDETLSAYYRNLASKLED